MTLHFDERDIAEARRTNALLAWTPRARVRTRIGFALLQGSLSALEPLSTLRLRRSGLVVENRSVSALGLSVRVRVIRPPTECRGVYLDMHGGGWAFGNAALDDRPNARLARELGLAVVSVDYRRVPTHPLSAAIDDCEAAAAWMMEHAADEFGTSTVFIGGESAGAHLAACTALRARRFAPVAGVVLFYGIYDLSGSKSLRRAGRETLVLHGPSLATSLDRLMAVNRVDERRDASISPLYADLTGLPPALFVVGTGDPLIDDSVAMAERWQAANHNAELVVVPEAPHAFTRLGTRVAAKTNAYAHAWLSRHLPVEASDKPLLRRPGS